MIPPDPFSFFANNSRLYIWYFTFHVLYDREVGMNSMTG